MTTPKPATTDAGSEALERVLSGYEGEIAGWGDRRDLTSARAYVAALQREVDELRAANNSRQRSIESFGMALREIIPDFRAGGTGEEHSAKCAAALLDRWNALHAKLTEYEAAVREHLEATEHLHEAGGATRFAISVAALLALAARLEEKP